MGAELQALWKASWGFGAIHFRTPFGVCGTASTNHRFDTTSMHRINSKLRTFWIRSLTRKTILKQVK